MSGEDESLKILEVLLTAEIFNQYTNLDVNDLTPELRELFGVPDSGEVKRPLYVSEGMIRKTLGITDACKKLQANPVVTCEEFGQRIRITTLEPASRWFINKGGLPLITENPALAYFFQNFDSVKVSYDEARQNNPLFQDTRVFIAAKIARITGDDPKMKSALDLVIVSAPEEIEQEMANLRSAPPIRKRS